MSPEMACISVTLSRSTALFRTGTFCIHSLVWTRVPQFIDGSRFSTYITFSAGLRTSEVERLLQLFNLFSSISAQRKGAE